MNVKSVGIRCIEMLCIENKAGVCAGGEAPDAAAILHLFSKNKHF